MEWTAGWYEKDLCAVCLTSGYCAGILLGMTTTELIGVGSTLFAARHLLREHGENEEDGLINRIDEALDVVNDEVVNRALDDNSQPLRTIVFTHGQIEPNDNMAVIAVPADWDADDIDRFIQVNTGRWTTAVVLTAEEATL
jgi:hypothetical protein